MENRGPKIIAECFLVKKLLGWGTKSITRGPNGDIDNPGLGAGWVLISREGYNIWTPTSIMSAQQFLYCINRYDNLGNSVFRSTWNCYFYCIINPGWHYQNDIQVLNLLDSQATFMRFIWYYSFISVQGIPFSWVPLMGFVPGHLRLYLKSIKFPSSELESWPSTEIEN